jgi:hypothetical protein
MATHWQAAVGCRGGALNGSISKRSLLTLDFGIRLTGHEFTLLHDLLSSLWHHEIQPKAWELSLLQPICKGGNKLKTDQASYRGIYLSNALAKLFEGILLHRLPLGRNTQKRMIR